MIEAPIETHVIDGIEVVFQQTPETEAPAEMHMFYPALRALNLAENATHNLHNVYPLRGAQVRDANAWAKYLNEAMDRFGREADVAFAQHHWPVWGTARVLEFLAKQRDLYKYLHDQTVRLMNVRGGRAAAQRRLTPRPFGGTVKLVATSPRAAGYDEASTGERIAPCQLAAEPTTSSR